MTLQLAGAVPPEMLLQLALLMSLMQVLAKPLSKLVPAGQVRVEHVAAVSSVEMQTATVVLRLPHEESLLQMVDAALLQADAGSPLLPLLHPTARAHNPPSTRSLRMVYPPRPWRESAAS